MVQVSGVEEGVDNLGLEAFLVGVPHSSEMGPGEGGHSPGTEGGRSSGPEDDHSPGTEEGHSPGTVEGRSSGPGTEEGGSSGPEGDRSPRSSSYVRKDWRI